MSQTVCWAGKQSTCSYLAVFLQLTVQTLARSMHDEIARFMHDEIASFTHLHDEIASSMHDEIARFTHDEIASA